MMLRVRFQHRNLQNRNLVKCECAFFGLQRRLLDRPEVAIGLASSDGPHKGLGMPADEPSSEAAAMKSIVKRTSIFATHAFFNGVAMAHKEKSVWR